ncbi:transcriptional repressor NF-X1 homolog [Nasonia vitripennis]|uniref:Uncharacterized protein n=1 Tax=Nasonia vitripennis TaxID=7425 RepID=A0A7M7Q0G3_NASVI|nr:transcriptional repressor NF-X1 homolog [Nasonia vitripennis]
MQQHFTFIKASNQQQPFHKQTKFNNNRYNPYKYQTNFTPTVNPNPQFINPNPNFTIPYLPYNLNSYFTNQPPINFTNPPFTTYTTLNHNTTTNPRKNSNNPFALDESKLSTAKQINTQNNETNTTLQPPTNDKSQVPENPMTMQE